jgi:exosome complex component RRP4
MEKVKIVAPGDLVGSSKYLMSGACTYEEGDEIYACVAGIVSKISKLIMVKPMKKKYAPNVGDIVVGRIMALEHSRWKVDINSYQHANCLHTAINMPEWEEGKTNDIISAEVQSLNSHNGSIFLQMRNMKYGKLYNGFYLKVNHNLIKRMKTHYLDLKFENVSVILGSNGYVWVYYNPATTKGANKSTDMVESLMLGQNHELNLQTAVEIPPKVMKNMAKVRNCIVVLDRLNLPIFEFSVNK